MGWAIALSILVVTAAGSAVVFVRRRRFQAHLAAVERRLNREAAPEVGQPLPAEVRALAERLGARGEAPARLAVLRQAGAMRRAPGERERRFTARQVIAVAPPGFLWRASFDPAGMVLVADSLAGGAGGVEARLLGAFTIMRVEATGAAAKGQMMRYLAELPWHPDAIPANPALVWRVIDASTIAVAAGEGAGRAEVTFGLDEQGLIASAEAPDRPRAEGRSMIERPWRGRFWDYREHAGRLLPMRAEVAWVLDGEDFMYWRGEVTAWEAV